jgi:hypothetical protein
MTGQESEYGTSRFILPYTIHGFVLKTTVLYKGEGFMIWMF